LDEKKSVTSKRPTTPTLKELENKNVMWVQIKVISKKSNKKKSSLLTATEANDKFWFYKKGKKIATIPKKYCVVL
jgi:hypothetical protein